MAEFEQECRERVDQLRTAFVELYDSIGADPTSPQEVARQLKVNKTLAWNVARLMQGADELTAIAHVPGPASLERVVQATVKHGADPSSVAKAREAIRDFDTMIRTHAGDRTTLDLIVDGSSGPSSGRLELSRKLAFRGNSGLYGIQARTRVATNFLAINKDDPSRLDMANVSGYVDCRRLRPGVRWPIVMKRSWGDVLDNQDHIFPEPIEPNGDGADGLQLIHSFTQGHSPRITPVKTQDGTDYVLEEGPLGNDGAFDCFWGDMTRSAVNRFAEKPADIGEFGTAITVPVERLIMDVFVERRLEMAQELELLVFGHIFAHGRPTGEKDDPSLMPIVEPVRTLSGTPPLVNTPAIPNYAKLVGKVHERCGWDPSQFRGMRMVMEYPPLGSTVILRFPLPLAPK